MTKIKPQLEQVHLFMKGHEKESPVGIMMCILVIT